MPEPCAQMPPPKKTAQPSTTAPAADPVSVTNASGVAGSKKEPKEADGKPQAPETVHRASAGVPAAVAAGACAGEAVPRSVGVGAPS